MKANLEIINHQVNEDGEETYDTRVLDIEIDGKTYTPDELLADFEKTKLGKLSPSLAVAVLAKQISNISKFLSGVTSEVGKNDST